MVGSKNLDIVSITSTEINTIKKAMIQHGFKLKDIVAQPYVALKEFKLEITDKKRTFMYWLSDVFDKAEDGTMIPTDDKILMVMEGNKDWLASFHKDRYLEGLGQDIQLHRQPKRDDFKTVASVIFTFYLLQHYLTRLPEVWIHTKKMVDIKQTKKDRKRTRGAHAVKLVNHYRFSIDELKRRNATGEMTRVYLCPCWGVRGHWRHLKDGRKIWINAYKKGKLKDNPEIYEHKTYTA